MKTPAVFCKVLFLVMLVVTIGLIFWSDGANWDERLAFVVCGCALTVWGCNWRDAVVEEREKSNEQK